MRRRLLGLVAGVVFATAATASAHHAVQAQFDVTQGSTELKGTLQKAEWINPHAKLHVLVKNPTTGQDESWEIQMAGTTTLRRLGFPLSARGGAQAGDPITVTVFKARNGSTTGLLRSITFADGKTFNRGVYGEEDLAK